MASNHFRVVAVFSLAYFVSYLFRGVNLGFTPVLSQEFGLSGANLGALTGLYFLWFAVAQTPSGLLLDRFGPRRATAGLLLVASAGALMFGISHSFGLMMVGR